MTKGEGCSHLILCEKRWEDSSAWCLLLSLGRLERRTCDPFSHYSIPHGGATLPFVIPSVAEGSAVSTISTWKPVHLPGNRMIGRDEQRRGGVGQAHAPGRRTRAGAG